jgi:hypothetical protein
MIRELWTSLFSTGHICQETYRSSLRTLNTPSQKLELGMLATRIHKLQRNKYDIQSFLQSNRPHRISRVASFAPELPIRLLHAYRLRHRRQGCRFGLIQLTLVLKSMDSGTRSPSLGAHPSINRTGGSSFCRRDHLRHDDNRPHNPTTICVSWPSV